MGAYDEQAVGGVRLLGVIRFAEQAACLWSRSAQPWRWATLKDQP